jgi:transposase
LGLLLAVAVMTANVQDKAGALLVLAGRGGAGKKLRRVWADGAYRSEQGHLATWLARHRINLTAVVPPEGQRGFMVLPRRWVVERTFGWLCQSRRLSKDYQRLPSGRYLYSYVALAIDLGTRGLYVVNSAFAPRVPATAFSLNVSST